MRSTLWKKAVVCVAAMSMVALAGCGSKENESAEGDLLARIREKGEIVVAMEGTWAPWTYHDENDKLVGFDVEVAENIASKLGVKATFVEGEWDGLLAGLEAGRYDCMVNGVDVTQERQQAYDFSEPYAFNRIALVVRSDNDSIKSFEDLAGKTTTNTISSTYAQLAEQYGATVNGVDDLNQTIELVLAGRADATLNSEVTIYDYLSEKPDAQLKIAALTEEATNVAIPMPKGTDTDSLREAVNKAIRELREEGVLAELSIKYFGTDITRETVE